MKCICGTEILVRSAFVASLSCALLGCVSQEEGASGSENDQPDQPASVTIALTTVPTSTVCIRITATPSSGSATVKTFTVTAGSSSTNLQVGPLLPGSYTFSADAFTVACTSIGSSVGSWIADPVPVTVRTGVATTVTMSFRKNNPVTVNANFLNNVQSMALGQTSSYIITDAGLLQTGLINGAMTFTRASFSAFDSSSVPGNAVAALAATYYGACAIRVDGTVWCWGKSQYGELGPGVGLGATAAAPVQVTGLSSAKLIAAGDFHVCAAATGSGGSGVYCWGYNVTGQLANGTYFSTQSPTLATSMIVKNLAATNRSTYIVDYNGNLYSAGDNSYGQLGDGTTTTRANLVQVETFVQTVVGGGYHACLLQYNLTVRCWGANFFGQIGDGTSTNRPLSTGLSVGIQALQISAGMYHTCALVWLNGLPPMTECWGYNGDGEVGNPGVPMASVYTTPVQVALNSVALTSLFSGPSAFGTCGLDSASNVYCWGSDNYGCFGDGTQNTAFLPIRPQLQ